METYITILVMGAVVVFAGIMLLSVKQEYMARATLVIGCVAAVLGLLLYGYSYLELGDQPVVAVLRSTFAVCRMFLGEHEYADLEMVALFQNSGVRMLTWVAHLLAFFTTASVAVSVIGKEALKKLRVRFSRRKEISILYGIHAEGVELGKNLENNKKNIVVYVDPEPESEASYQITAAGQLLRNDSKATSGSRAFLRSVGAFRKNRKVTLYALAADPVQNLHYAKNILAALKEGGAAPADTRLVILSREDLPVDSLQNREGEQDGYGYGFVTPFREYALAARLLIRNYPPCDYITFDENGRAKEDFHVLMIGFGRVGQAVMKQLIMNGQFAGAEFRAKVFDPQWEGATGFFTRQHPGIGKNYDLTFDNHEGRSEELCKYLAENKDSIRYVVVNTGSPERNDEIAEDLVVTLRQLGSKAPVIQCTHREICMQTVDAEEPVRTGVYSSDVLYTNDIDDMAMLVNQQYQSNGKTALENWMVCDFFSRMSCRAFADAIHAFLKAAHKTEEQVLRGDWDLPKEQLENLSIMEHERWAAFHYCMGFQTMTREEFDDRASQYETQKKAGKPSIRIGKNMADKTHACLVHWDELDKLSQRENSFTGKKTDYKQMDRDNVMTIPELLKTWKKSQ